MNNFSSNNVSERFHAVWIAPERTGSRTVAQILNYCGFQRNQKPISLCEIFNYTHRFKDPGSFNDWVQVCSARNPYARTYSVYKMLAKQEKTPPFKEFVLNRVFNKMGKEMFLAPYFLKKPDYIVRLENLKEDLIKIPFVTECLTPNQLDYMTTHGKPLSSWEEDYNDEMKEIIYNTLKNHFVTWGYDK
jgi:hypothetical protein